MLVCHLAFRRQSFGSSRGDSLDVLHRKLRESAARRSPKIPRLNGTPPPQTPHFSTPSVSVLALSSVPLPSDETSLTLVAVNLDMVAGLFHLGRGRGRGECAPTRRAKATRPSVGLRSSSSYRCTATAPFEG